MCAIIPHFKSRLRNVIVEDIFLSLVVSLDEKTSFKFMHYPIAYRYFDVIKFCTYFLKKEPKLIRVSSFFNILYLHISM